MVLRVVGAGFGRTGTTSLKAALEQLGFSPCYHMMELVKNPTHGRLWAQAHREGKVDWDELFERYQATLDWPACNFWRELSAYYPRSKVILSVRDPERWFASIHNTIYRFSAAQLRSSDPAIQKQGQRAFEFVWDGIFGGRMDDKVHVLRVFREHNEEVQRTIPPERLLVFEPEQGWPALCGFLGVPIPETPFPHTNTTEEFRQAFERRKAQASADRA